MENFHTSYIHMYENLHVLKCCSHVPRFFSEFKNALATESPYIHKVPPGLTGFSATIAEALSGKEMRK